MPRTVDPGTIRTGSGLAGPGSVEAGALVPPAGSSDSLDVHILDPTAAHPASAISVDDAADVYDGDDAETAFVELGGLVPPRPATVGNWRHFLTLRGIPDWGSLKLADAGLVARGLLTSANLDVNIYPYYYTPPEVSDDVPPFTPSGNDPSTDPTFNVVDGAYTGGGQGIAYSGGFTRAAADISETVRLIPYAGMGTPFPVVVSGTVYPANMGVLALLYFPAPGDLASFMTQPLADRCMCALLLGNGIESGCDGTVGGIWTSNDPYDFPGAATGQFDLNELFTGVSATGGAAPPAADADAGRVRLGFDILGASTNANVPVIGDDWRNDNNFFRYRLPYTSNYTTATGLRYLPTVERHRFFGKPAVSLNPMVDLTQGGDYPDFEADYYTYQLARFRQRVMLPELGAAPRDQGSLVLLHFKTETAFEDLVLNGVAPSASDLWSANVVDWTGGMEDVDNLTEGASGLVAASYHVLRGLIIEDSIQVPVADGASGLAYTVGGPATTMMVSGIEYFIPGGGAPFTFSTLIGRVNNAWANTYRMSENGGATIVSPGLTGPNPGFIYLGAFSGGMNHTIPVGFGTVAYQRVELEYARMDATSGHGAFDLTNGPQAADQAAITLGAGTIVPNGDGPQPRFSTDAIVKMYLRLPLGHGSAANAVWGMAIPALDGNTVLFHTTNGAEFLNPTGAGVSPVGTETADKDVEERFLDEVYRYDSTWSTLPSPGNLERLVGPGIPTGAAVVAVPVRAGSSIGVYAGSSWIQTGLHAGVLPAGEAQVAGIPDRDPPLTDGVEEAHPSNGLLRYPVTNYSVGHRPSLADGDIVAPQPDYSAYAGDRVYVRCLDAAFSASASPVVAAGQPFYTLRIDGVRLAAFAFAGGGPGGVGLAIMTKVPGLTTWMDCGLADGGGPGKQDLALDGAGCYIAGPLTFEAQDPTTGIWYSQVRVNAGGVANLFVGVGAEVPVLVKIIIKDNATGKAFNLAQGGPTGTVANLCGVIGISLVHP